MDDTLYLLTLKGIYDQGPLGIFQNEKDARNYAESLYEESDGYHGFVIYIIKPNTQLVPKRHLGKNQKKKLDFEDQIDVETPEANDE